jgi:hypothetical protein
VLRYTQFLILAASVASVAFTIARTKVTEPLRKKVMLKSKWFGQLIGCPYCLSHWLSFGAVATYQLKIIDGVVFLDYVVTAMAMVAVAAFIVGLITQALSR